MAAVTVTSAFPAGRGDAAAAFVFEYMAATQAENGRPVPAGIGELPAALRRECSSLPDVYRPPGVFLIADLDGQPAGCVGPLGLARRAHGRSQAAIRPPGTPR